MIYVMFGVRRSGNHAFQNLLLKDGGTLYNDMRHPLPRGWRFQKSKIRKFGTGEGDTIISFEDIMVEPVPEADSTIILIRSAYNAFASRLCATSQYLFDIRAKNFTEAMEAWIQHSSMYTDKFEEIDFGGIRKHRPSWNDENYHERWKRVQECPWKGWEKLWFKLLDDDQIRDRHHETYGWCLSRDGQMLS